MDNANRPAGESAILNAMGAAPCRKLDVKGIAMKVLGYGVLVLLALAVVLVLAGQMGMLTGQPPTDLGVRDGRLKPPSSTPNSVSSQADLYADHPQRDYARIAPLAITGSGDAALARLATMLQATPGCKLVTEQADYLYAQCTTPLLKFTDDVEFWLDRSAQVVHVRSASRLGQGDLQANRKRVEKIRAQFDKN